VDQFFHGKSLIAGILSIIKYNILMLI